MKTFSVQLKSIADVKNFVNAACTQPCDIDIVSGRYVIDAKSIMGIFSLDLSKPFTVELHGTDEDAEAFAQNVGEFIEKE
ncbi:MAG: HPr family phosphocarrier protein [Oscillospiraceae bacterium]|jgi:phosphotransferase system HPr-like phosphotransfer protein|nr:HPr family phosphocarrier protein [Oscillospiraceae bacterium]